MTTRKTKIIVTIGPASKSKEVIIGLINAGANAFRLNFSHGTHAEHSEVLKHIRSASQELHSPVAIIQDLAGPKIRISQVENETTQLNDGAIVKLKLATTLKTNSEIIYINSVDPVKVLKKGHEVLFADGTIQLVTEVIASDHVQCKIIRGGMLRSRVGIAFPDSDLELPVTTDKDLKDLEWGLANKVDYVALSFVQSAENIALFKKQIENSAHKPNVIAKIERKRAVEKIDEILKEANAIMVARGDLGVEIPVEQIPQIQRDIIARANYRGFPVIVATQMLFSMVNSIRPTRAEVVDCAFAVMAGTDAVMLSEETAIGNYPIDSVKYLDRIALEAEKSFQFDEYKLRLRDADRDTVPDSIAYAACAAAAKVQAANIVACTETGATARLVAKYRPSQPLFGVSKVAETLQRMCLYWGVIPIACPTSKTRAEEIDQALKLVKQAGKFADKELSVVLGGLSVGAAGSTSIMEVRGMV